MGLVHKSKDHFLIARKASSELAPELSKLCSCSSLRVSGVSDDAPGRGLLRRIVVSHVVMGI